MLCVLPEGSCGCMSVIIGICGENYCAIIGDRRKIKPTSTGWEPVDDETQKVFSINKDVLFGVSGLFVPGEDFLDPFKVYSDNDAITLRLAVKAVKGYLERHSYQPVRRHYIICGRDNKGVFRAYGISCEAEIPTVTVVEYTPGIVIALPPTLRSEVDTYLRKIKDCIESSTAHEEMLEKVCRIVHEIADKDISVGKEVDVLFMS